eukprot:3559090-Amphidinium_carterae.2
MQTHAMTATVQKSCLITQVAVAMAMQKQGGYSHFHTTSITLGCFSWKQCLHNKDCVVLTQMFPKPNK